MLLATSWLLAGLQRCAALVPLCFRIMVEAVPRCVRCAVSHAQIKSSNVLLTRDLTAKVIRAFCMHHACMPPNLHIILLPRSLLPASCTAAGPSHINNYLNAKPSAARWPPQLADVGLTRVMRHSTHHSLSVGGVGTFDVSVPISSLPV